MASTLYIFFTLVFTLVDIYAYYRFLTNKLTYRFSQHTLIPAYIISYLFMILTTYAPELFPDTPLKIVFFLLFYISFLVIYKDVFYIKLFWIVIVTFAQITCEMLALPIALMLTKTELSNLLYNPLPHLLGLLLSRTLFLLAIELLIRAHKKLFSDLTKTYFVILFVDVIYASVIFNLFYYQNLFLDVNIAVALSIFAIFLISLLALYLLRKITKKSDEIMTTNLKLQQIEMEHKQNQDMVIVVEDLRALRHDMNNHMSVLQGLLTMGEYEDAKAYLSTITEELTVANSFIFTDNKVLSVLINNKISKAKQSGITFDTEILTSTTPFSDSDLCAVIGNILENAIEASSKHDNPYIYFSMKKANHKLLIQCDNTYSVPPIFEKGNLVTTKSDKSFHGIGTKTIRSVVDDYHGTTEFTVDELFHINISVPL